MLKAFVTAPDFKVKQHNIKDQKFSNTDEYRQLQRYLYLKKSNRIKTYFRVLNSPIYANFKALENSEELKYYEELLNLVHSTAFISLKSQGRKVFKASPEYTKAQEFKLLKKETKFKSYFKFKDSTDYRILIEVEKSGDIAELEKLEQFVNSPEYKKVKDYMDLSSNQKWTQSEEYKNQQEYLQLVKSEKVIWYYKIKDSNKFDEIKKWKVTFEDNFDSNELDREAWLTRYYWGDTLLHNAYSLAADKHFFTDGRNIEISNSILKIITRPEKVVGQAWDPEKGFFPKEFEITSGIINTGKSFRQKYGRFQAKVKISPSDATTHAFWMLSNTIVPQIDILKNHNNKVHFNHFFMNGNGIRKNTSNVGAGKVSNDYFIYELEWSADKLVWKINGLEMYTQIESVPQDPMYLILSSGVYDDKDLNCAVSMEIDWIKVYQKN
jgi:beta-glucanase (GH16 family)